METFFLFHSNSTLIEAPFCLQQADVVGATKLGAEAWTYLKSFSMMKLQLPCCLIFEALYFIFVFFLLLLHILLFVVTSFEQGNEIYFAIQPKVELVF